MNADMWSAKNDLPRIILLANSIIGVSILALPFSFKQSGILLSLFLFCIASWINKTSCYLLIKSCLLTNYNSYENIAYVTLHNTGKIITELSIIGFLLGICSAYFVVIGDLVPSIITSWGLFNDIPFLRTYTLIIVTFFVIIPLSSIKNLEQLNNVSMICLLFYMIFNIKIFFVSLPNLLDLSWLQEISLWRLTGIFHSLPVISLSLTCQTQIFLVYQELHEPNLKRISNIYTKAINLCTIIYIFVGSLGYLAFYRSSYPLKGDILINLNVENRRIGGESSIVTDLITLGFALSSAMSFPLSLLPCKECIIHVLFAQRSTEKLNYHKESMGSIKQPSSYDSLLDLEMDANTDKHYDSDEESAFMRKRSPENYDAEKSSQHKTSISAFKPQKRKISPITDRLITLAIVFLTLAVALYFPDIEFILGIIGSVMGTLLCCILPALIFLAITPKSPKISINAFNKNVYSNINNNGDRRKAQILFGIGLIIAGIGALNYLSPNKKISDVAEITLPRTIQNPIPPLNIDKSPVSFGVSNVASISVNFPADPSLIPITPNPQNLKDNLLNNNKNNNNNNNNNNNFNNNMLNNNNSLLNSRIDPHSKFPDLLPDQGRNLMQKNEFVVTPPLDNLNALKHEDKNSHYTTIGAVLSVNTSSLVSININVSNNDTILNINNNIK